MIGNLISVLQNSYQTMCVGRSVVVFNYSGL